MSWKASAYVKALLVCPSGEPISRSEKFVALILADSHQDKARHFTYPAVKTIAEDALMDERACRRILGALERKGVIVRERNTNQGRGQLTFYRFPELDGKGGQDAPLLKPEKGDTASPFAEPQKEDRRGTEGGQKGDNSGPPYKEEQKQEQKQKPTPPTPSPCEGVQIAEGDLGRARIAFSAVIDAMRDRLLNNRPKNARPNLADGFGDWQKFRFGDLAVGGWSCDRPRDGPARAVLTVQSPDVAATTAGLGKYAKAWDRLTAEWFGCGVVTVVEARTR